ncbi:uncharacterized protein RAG0_15905 [Rhynchosporium agropyri]|uniref:Uncharacterized protein n=1 Tax=Rhynchosporium agropyri TaxID=914238 RepID=A0A1E1LN05_9HELO|nr:uncharacterized protein RAG0_15905 [Rhynchosporium agropyri]
MDTKEHVFPTLACREYKYTSDETKDLFLLRDSAEIKSFQVARHSIEPKTVKQLVPTVEPTWKLSTASSILWSPALGGMLLASESAGLGGMVGGLMYSTQSFFPPYLPYSFTSIHALLPSVPYPVPKIVTPPGIYLDLLLIGKIYYRGIESLKEEEEEEEEEEVIRPFMSQGEYKVYSAKLVHIIRRIK